METVQIIVLVVTTLLTNGQVGVRTKQFADRPGCEAAATAARADPVTTAATCREQKVPVIGLDPEVAAQLKH
jgi:hypothetical protein